MEKIPSRILDALNIVHLIVTLNVTFFSVFNKAQSFDHMCLYFFSSVNCLSIFECFANKAFVSYLFNQQLSPNSNHTKNLLNCIAYPARRYPPILLILL